MTGGGGGWNRNLPREGYQFANMCCGRVVGRGRT